MLGSGKFNLPGIREKGAALIKAVLFKMGIGAVVMSGPLKKPVNTLIEFLIEYLTNQGIILINLGVIKYDKAVDSRALLKALEEGLLMAEKPGLSKAQGDYIDEQVKKAFRRAVRYNRK